MRCGLNTSYSRPDHTLHIVVGLETTVITHLQNFPTCANNPQRDFGTLTVDGSARDELVLPGEELVVVGVLLAEARLRRSQTALGRRRVHIPRVRACGKRKAYFYKNVKKWTK